MTDRFGHQRGALNPMVGVIDAFRWALLDDRRPLDVPLVAMSLGVSTVLFVSGLR